jgi:CrcB protein
VATILWVGLGGCLGSIARYLLSEYVQGKTGGSFPFGTLVVNVAGCFVIGGLTALFEGTLLPTPEARAFLIAGILGGFTTFSAFGNETLLLLREAGAGQAMANVVAQLVLGLGAAWLGRAALLTFWR